MLKVSLDNSCIKVVTNLTVSRSVPESEFQIAISERVSESESEVSKTFCHSLVVGQYANPMILTFELYRVLTLTVFFYTQTRTRSRTRMYVHFC